MQTYQIEQKKKRVAPISRQNMLYNEIIMTGQVSSFHPEFRKKNKVLKNVIS